jgi:histidine phosphotransferase ChpT
MSGTLAEDVRDRNLAALVAARICHDVVSPLGAIGNGLELLELAGAADGPELALVRESAGNAMARIRLFRLAFGDARPGQRVAGGEVEATLRAALEQPRRSLHAEMPADLARTEARIGCLAALCADAALIQGGDLRLGFDGAAWRIEATAPRLRQSLPWGALTAASDGAGAGAGARAGMASPEVEAEPATVQFALLAGCLAEAGRRAEISHSDTALEARL